VCNIGQVVARLAANPRLARNESFLNKWPELNSFFDKYPGSKDRFLSDPVRHSLVR